MSKELNALASKLYRSRRRYDGNMLTLEAYLINSIEFNFFVSHQTSDGHVIVNKNTLQNAPLSSCISIINRKGILTQDDFNLISI